MSLLPANAASADSSAHGNAASVPIPPSLVVSVSTPGVALMDYSPRGSGELEVRKGQPLRILKRYNHWSYAIKEDGDRGWLPSWFCGRANKTALAASSTSSTATGHPPTDGATTAPSTPATPTVPSSNTAGSSGSVPSLTTLTSPISSLTSLAPPVHPYAAAVAGAGDASVSTSQSSTTTPIPTPGHPGSLGNPDLSVAVSPASLRPGPLPTMTTTNGSSGGGVAGLGGPRSAGPTMQQDGISGAGAGAGPERSTGGLPSSRSADAALAGTK